MSRALIDEIIAPRFADGPLQGLPDSATLDFPAEKLVFTTDSFVVQPLFFPGGDIGKLAVHGTVNDLSVAGGAPLWLSLSLILEEGLRIDLLEKVLDSIRAAADEAEVTVVTGDTKVVANGQCDQLYINTSGIGSKIDGLMVSPASICEGDTIIASGTIGDHGMAVLTARNEMELRNGPRSDTAPLHRLVRSLTPEAGNIRFMRDPTRGGVATVLYEAAEGLGLDFILDEGALPYSRATSATSEILGLDPLNSPCEGRMVLICSTDSADRILAAWSSVEEGRNAAVIGRIERGKGRVVLETLAGGRRLITPPSGELLPRIC